MSDKSMTGVIDIIVPVYNALSDLRPCVDSVRRCSGENYRLILIDDCSPDPDIAKFFEEIQSLNDNRITLLRNGRNLGFVGTANRGMGLSGNAVVLLNSDTIVTAGWLAKMQRCAASDSRIGTITPFSNNAEICSFPELCANAPLEANDPELLNRAIEEAALPSYPDIPTAVGFCMYIRRSLLNEIGLFDGETFGLGYGEENDFCMRAIAAGYRNVLCDDTFVAHVGNSSFSDKKQALVETNIQRLLAKHPDYMKRVLAFIAADPIKPIRDMAQTFLALQDRARARPGILHILHGRKGGTEQHSNGLIQAAEGDFRHYLLITLGETWVLEDASGRALITYQFEHQQDELWADLLGGVCAAFRIDMCHVHHLSGSRLGLLQAFSTLPVPYGVTIHDFYLACPTINLLDESGKFCDAQTDVRRCQNCLNAQPSFKNIQIEEWRTTHRQFVDRAAFIIAPTQWAAQVFARYYPRPNIWIIPHGIPGQHTPQAAMCPVLLLPRDRCHNVGVLGAIGPVKGSRNLERLVKRTRERGLPLRWIVVGYLDRQFQPHQDADKVLTVHGQYDRKDVEDLLDHYRIRLLVFPSAGPETFSYTLTEGWAAGRPALVPPIGALGERMLATGAGWLMEDWLEEDKILDQAMLILAPENQGDFERRAQLARNTPVATLQRMAQETQRVYGEIVAHQVAYTTIKPLSKLRMLQALRAAGGTALEARRAPTLPGKVLTKFAHWALRLRYTGLGRWLYGVVPLRWQRRLKQQLLA